MFGKIKGKLKNVFKSSEDYVEDNHDKIEEAEVIESLVREDGVAEDHILKEKDIEDPTEIKVEKSIDDVEEKFEDDEMEDKPKKKGFLGRLFGSKSDDDISEVENKSLNLENEKDVEELEKIEEEMLSDVTDSEKRAIKEHSNLSEKEINYNKKDLDEKFENEVELEKKVMSDVVDSSRMETISDELELDINEKNIDKIVHVEDEVLKDSLKLESELDVEEVGEIFVKTKEKVKEFEKEEKKGIFSKLKAKTILEEDFDNIWVELQMFLLEINIAFGIVEKIGKRLKIELVGKSFNRFKLSGKIREILESEVEEVLCKHEASFLDKLNSFSGDEPVKILVLGVNGTGKTTTIAKIVKYLQINDKSVVVAAADTFRAAAVEQLEEHSKILNFKLIMHRGGSDPAAVAFDAIEHAKAKKIDVVLIDTAGRMPNNSNLMMELEKVKRVSKSDMAIFVGDSVSGNDLIEQVDLFNNGVKIDGTILTKVDTDEKPGSVVTIAYSIDKPIYFLGVGQGYDDLVVFDSKQIAEKLFDLEEE